jgi:cyclopropane-fatty-acyl-phospholipid synthase
MSGLGIQLAEHALLPDAAIRLGIRRLLARRLDELERGAGDDAEQRFADGLRQHGVAEDTAAANAQHYEVPSAFFETILGPRMKYSSAWYPQADTTLAEAERLMLDLTIDRAQLRDDIDILELGCGWGSLTLRMAERFPAAGITAVTNSGTQAAFVRQRAAAEGLRGISVLRADAGTFLSDRTYDRIVSVEMFEHMRNYGVLFDRIRSWLNPAGKLFVHVFAHRRFPYLFETEGADNWMGRYFFTGGTMPSFGLLPRVAGALALEESWWMDGRHYARTLEDWLLNLDERRADVRRIFAETHGPSGARVQIQRWRMFLMACAELFAYQGGKAWGVAHYRFARGAEAVAQAPAGARANARQQGST